jgi:hypothetical protein
MPLNLIELTARVCPLVAGQPIVRERIKHWTKRGILLGSAPGQGGVRLWRHTMILDAALLNVFVDHGLQPVQWNLKSAFHQLRDAAEAWAAGDRSTRWLQISFFRGRPGRVGWMLAEPLVAQSKQQQPKLSWVQKQEALLVVDLCAILEGLGWGPDDQKAVEADMRRRI